MLLYIFTHVHIGAISGDVTYSGEKAFIKKKYIYNKYFFFLHAFCLKLSTVFLTTTRRSSMDVRVISCIQCWCFYSDSRASKWCYKHGDADKSDALLVFIAPRKGGTGLDNVRAKLIKVWVWDELRVRVVSGPIREEALTVLNCSVCAPVGQQWLWSWFHGANSSTQDDQMIL